MGASVSLECLCGRLKADGNPRIKCTPAAATCPVILKAKGKPAPRSLPTQNGKQPAACASEKKGK